jgi:hypothetical protein
VAIVRLYAAFYSGHFLLLVFKDANLLFTTLASLA